MEQKNTWADPSALGQFGLAIVTLVAGAEKLGLFENSGALYALPWAIFLGALAQIVTGIIDFKKGKQFGGTVFCAYGFFWLAIGMTWGLKLGLFDNYAGQVSNNTDDLNMALGFAYLGYLIFTIFATIGSLTTNKVLTWLFILIDVLFLGLVIYSFTHNETAKTIAAYAELAIGFSALYSVGAMTVNAQFGRTVLPLGKAFVSVSK